MRASPPPNQKRASVSFATAPAAPLSLERLSVSRGGKVVDQLRDPIGAKTHRVMEPYQFLARLCALTPPPRHPLIRFHGVLAPNNSWRKEVVPNDAGLFGKVGPEVVLSLELVARGALADAVAWAGQIREQAPVRRYRHQLEQPRPSLDKALLVHGKWLQHPIPRCISHQLAQ